MIEVVSAVIIRDGRILLTQRRPEKDFPFMWESPGGKVEEGENAYLALRRETVEELSVVLEPEIVEDVPIWEGEFHNVVSRKDRASIHLRMYRVRLGDGQAPLAAEGQGLGWFTADEMMALHLAPANTRARTTIRNLMIGGAP